MKVAAVLCILASVATAWGSWDNCPDVDATAIVNKYISILLHQPDINGANATAQALLADDYTESSDSVSTLLGLPLGQPPVVGKQYYAESNLNQPPLAGVNTISIIPACGYITWYWVYTGIGTKEYEIRGMHLFQVTDQGQLQSAVFEFNSVAWGADIGYVTLTPGQNCTSDPTLTPTPLKKRTRTRPSMLDLA